MRVVVVGGGFAGVYAIKALQDANIKNLSILLFEPRERFVFTPLLHEVAADNLHVPSVTHAYTDIFRHNMKHIRKRAERIDLKKKNVYAEGRKQPYAFDYIIIAPGSKTRLPAGMTDTLELKNIDDALTIRRRVEQNVIRAADALQNGEKVGSLLSCVIVGGGPTGVELAGELVDFYKYRMAKEYIVGRKPQVTLVQSGKTILPGADSAIQRIAKEHLERIGVGILTDARVSNVAADRVMLKNGRALAAACIIWTAGVVPNTIAIPGTQQERGRLCSEQTLQLPGYPFAFTLGDASHIAASPLPDLAQVAVQQGTCAGKNIARIARGGKPKRFAYDDKGTLFSLGQRYGVGRVQGVLVTGFFAWFVWRTVYLMKFVGVRSKLRMAGEYTRRLFGRSA